MSIKRSAGYLKLRLWRIVFCYWNDAWDGRGFHIGWRMRAPGVE